MIAWLNALPGDRAHVELRKCCGSNAWVSRMVSARPFPDRDSLLGTSDSIWWSLTRTDWLEAFAAHPRIGSKGDVEKKSGSEKAWAEGEQSGAARAGDEVLVALAAANTEYEARFGHIYIVCATGKSAAEMLTLARSRLSNDAETELRIAAEEQRKITHIRLNKLLEAPAMSSGKITTHILDTARGRPAGAVPIVLEKREGTSYRELGRGVTDDDGRLKTLMAEGAALEAGTYRLTFDVASYLEDAFFPEVQITFVVRDAGQHHHVPLLLSPFGYSTYRGS